MKQCSSDARTMGHPTPAHKAQGHRLEREVRREAGVLGGRVQLGSSRASLDPSKGLPVHFPDFVARVSNDLALAIGMTVCSEPT